MEFLSLIFFAAYDSSAREGLSQEGGFYLCFAFFFLRFILSDICLLWGKKQNMYYYWFRVLFLLVVTVPVKEEGRRGGIIIMSDHAEQVFCA